MYQLIENIQDVPKNAALALWSKILTLSGNSVKVWPWHVKYTSQVPDNSLVVFGIPKNPYFDSSHIYIASFLKILIHNANAAFFLGHPVPVHYHDHDHQPSCLSANIPISHHIPPTPPLPPKPLRIITISHHTCQLSCSWLSAIMPVSKHANQPPHANQPSCHHAPIILIIHQNSMILMWL